MKKRFLSGFLAVVMCLSLLPATAWADGADAGETVTAESGTGTAESGGASSGGADQWESPLVGMTISGAVWSGEKTMIRATDGDAMSGGEKDRSRIFGALVSAPTDDYGGPVTFYFPEDNASPNPTRRVSFFCDRQLDASKIVLGQGATLAGSFQETVLGSGTGAIYLYQGLVTFHKFQAMFYYGEGEQADIVGGNADVEQLAMVNTYVLPETDEGTAYVGEVFVTAANGDKLTVEISGVNLPDGEAGSQYSIRNDPSYVGEVQSGEGAVIYTCEGYDQAASDPDHGVYAYTMTPTGATPQDSWFPLYIGEEQAMFYGNYNEPVTLPTLAPMSAVSSGGGAGSLSVSVPARVTTTSGSAAIPITNNGYTQMRYKVDAAFTAEDATAWTAIPASVTVNVGTTAGRHTVYFQFRDGSGHSDSASTTVYQQSSARLPAPAEVGLLSGNKIVSPDENNVYHLIDGATYTMWAKLEGGQDKERDVVVSWTGHSFTLGWNGTNDRYEKAVTFSSGQATDTLTFRAKQLDTDATPHDSAQLGVSVTTLPGVYMGWVPYIQASYEDGAYLVKPGQSIRWSFTGDVETGYSGYAKLTYKDGSGTEKTAVSARGSESGGYYSGTVNIPSDAAELVNITYYLATSENPETTGRTKVYSQLQYKVGIPLEFELGTDYADATVEITRTANGSSQDYYRYGWVDSAGKATLDGVSWGDGVTYTYTITGHSGQIKTGTLTQGKNTYTKGELSLPTLHTVTVELSTTITGNRSSYWGIYPKLFWRLGNENEHGVNLTVNSYHTSGDSATVDHIPEGAEVRVGATVNNDGIRAITRTVAGGLTSTGDLTATVGGSDGVITVDAELFETDTSTITGTLLKPNNSTPLGWAGVTVRQEADTGAGENGILNARHLSAYRYGNADENGFFSVGAPLTGFKAEVTVRAQNYQTVVKEVDPVASGTNSLGSIKMEYQDELVVTPILSVEPLRDQYGNALSNGSAQGDTSLLVPAGMWRTSRPGDDSNLSYSSESLGDGQTKYFFSSSNSTNVQPGDKIRVYFHELSQDSGLVLAGNRESADNTYRGLRYVDGTLDSKRNMTITVNAQHLGEVRATVVPESAGGDYIGRLLVYSSWGQDYATLAGQAAGRGELKVSDLPAGQYTVVTVMYTREKADLVSSLIERGQLHSALSNSSTYSTYYADAVRELRVTENVRVVNGQVNSLGTLTPEKALDRAVLGDYVIRSSVTQIKPDGTSQVNVWIAPDPSVLDPRPLTEVQVLRGDGEGALQASWKSAAFSDSPQYGDDGYQYTSSAAVNFKVNDQQTVLRLSYTVKPKDQETEIRSQVYIQYQPGNRWSDYYNTGTASLSIRESVDRLELSVPERVLRAVTMQADSLNEVDENKSDAWTVPVTIFASPKEGGSVVNVYDNGVGVGTFPVTEVTTEVTVNLTRPYEFGLHELYATRTADNSDTTITTKSYVTVADRSREINVSHYIWWHHNDRGLQQWNYKTLDELAGKTIRYWPSENSAFAFAIENAREDELANVTFNTAYEGNSPDKTWGAAPISKEQFKAYWMAAKGATWDDNYFNENTSFWVVDAGSDQKARGETVSSQIDPATMRVDEHGFSAGYFDSFNVSYHYLGGTNVDLLAVALLPTDPTDIEKLTSEDIKTLLSVIDTASDGLTAVGLENYYSVMGGSLHTFADREGGNRASVLADAKNSDAANHDEALKDFKENLLLANVDSLPADLRDAINASYTDPNTNKVTSTVMNDAAKAEAAENPGETVYDGYKVEINVGEEAKAIKKMESAVTWSSVEIPDVNQGRFKTAADGTRSAVQEGDAAYIDPNSSDAVEWLMNYELDKKDHGTPEEKEKYKDVTWTSYESAQGTVYERQEVKYTKQEDNTYKIETELSSYLPKVAVKAMLGDTQYDSMVTMANAAPLRNAPLVTSAGKLTGDMLAAGGSNLMAATWQTTADQDKGVERLQTVNTVYSTLNTVEDAREAIKVSHTYADLSKGTAQTWAGGERLTQASAGGKALGQGLNILGAVTTAYDIKKGPQGKNEDLLYEALNLVKDPKDRQQLSESIAHYSEFKNEIYGTDCAVGATTAGLSFAPAPVSAVSTIAGLKYSQNSSAAKADLSAEYDGILNTIAQTLRVQDAREVYQGKQDAALAALTSRLEREGFAGAQLQAELSKFTLTKDATGAFGYEPVEGWGQAVGVDPTKLYGYVPEQPDLNKFEIDYGPSFGGKVPTQAELDEFYGGTDGFTAKMEEDKRTSTSLEDLINKVENDLKTSDGKPLFDIEFNSTFSLDEAFPSFKLYIDPSGYAFEGVEEDRVAGVEATILQGDGNDIDSTTAYTAWVDTNEAVEERQANPQYTAALDADNPDAGGRYGWMTPSGVWKVRFRGVTASDDNGNKDTREYQTTETKPMEVPPEHTAVNIGLLSTAAPKVAEQTEPAENKPNYSVDDINTNEINENHLLSAYVNQMTVQFDKWMQLESLVDVTPDGVSGGDESFGSDTAFLAVTDADGNLVSGTFAFPDKTANTGYKASYTVDGETVENLYQTDYIGSDWFVKTVIFTPESAFDPTKNYTVTVSKTALSYAGVALSETADFTATVQPSEKSAPLVFNVTFVYGDGRPNTTGVTAADGTVTLPTPTRDGYTFLGWYTAASGGERITAATVFTKDTTAYAQWRQNGGSSGSSGSGSAAVSTTASSGDTISANTIDRLISGKKELTVTGDNKATAVFSTDALKGIDKATNSSVTVKLEDVSDDYAKTYPDGEVYQLAVSAGSKELSNLGGDVTVTLPHDRGKEETNPDRITVFALNGDGTVGERLDTDYDEKVGTVTFTTDEAGAFLIDYIPFPFEDVREDTYYYDAADWAEWNGITTGKTEKVFDPLGNASRAEVVTFLWRCAGSPEPKAKRSEFADVSDDAWYVKAVLWAAEQDITKGTGEGNFSPAMTVTRDQFVTLLYRMEGTAPTGANPFTDVKREDYYYEAVLWASKSGVTNGTGGTLFSPDWYCDRGQVVTMLYRWFGKE